MTEIWESPIFSVEERLELAIGGIVYRDKVLAALASRLDQAVVRAERAERAATRAGYTYTEGAAEWRPPIGKPPRFRESDITSMSLAIRRAVPDECAYWPGWPGPDRLATVAYDALYAEVERRS